MAAARVPPCSHSSNMRPRVRNDDPLATESSPHRRPDLHPFLPVLHVSEYFLVVDKPADMRIDGDAFPVTVERLAQRWLDRAPASLAAQWQPTGMRRVGHVMQPLPPPRVRLVHQLDYATSGVMLLALQRVPAAHAVAAFARRAMHKEYRALVHGWMLGGRVGATTTLTWPIRACADDFRMQVGKRPTEDADAAARPAITRLQLLAVGTCAGVPVSDVLVQPETGRRHQIRVHLQAAGHGIVGDATYPTRPDETQRFPRMMLHAWRLHLPATLVHQFGLPQTLQAPLPVEFAEMQRENQDRRRAESECRHVQE